MKHLEVRQKYSAARRIFNSLLGVSSGDETLHLMFDILLPTLLGPRTLITHGLQRLMGCIPPTMHCRSTLLGVVASVCTPLPTQPQQLPTLLAQQFWELLRPFVCSLISLEEKHEII